MAELSPRRRTARIVLITVVAVLVVAALVGWRLGSRGSTTATPAGTTSATRTSAAPSNTTPSATGASSASALTPSTSGSPVPAGCSSPTEAMDEPTTFTIDSMKVSSHVLSLGLDESGAAQAPPKNDSQGVAWFDEGPKVGAAKGNAVLSIHTYRNGGALGNALHDEKTGLKPGALVRISDASGTTVCYTLERETKVWVKDYDPNSNVVYDYEGKPQAVIVICWDFDPATQAWDSRILYYLKPVAPAA